MVFASGCCCFSCWGGKRGFLGRRHRHRQRQVIREEEGRGKGTVRRFVLVAASLGDTLRVPPSPLHVFSLHNVQHRPCRDWKLGRRQYAAIRVHGRCVSSHHHYHHYHHHHHHHRHSPLRPTSLLVSSHSVLPDSVFLPPPPPTLTPRPLPLSCRYHQLCLLPFPSHNCIYPTLAHPTGLT